MISWFRPCSPHPYWIGPVMVAAMLAGCSAPQRRAETYRASVRGGVIPAGVVFAANGAGDVGSLSQNLAKILDKAPAPLELRTVNWSLGYKRYVADQVDHDNHLVKGRQLAGELIAYRATYPERRIYLIGHSAGGAILLAAADLLPPDSVDRIILLSPSVCRTADLRPALRASRCGIDVFHSDRDRWILGLGMRIFGTTERNCREAAGKYGFTPQIASPADAAIYSRLRQHPWDPVVAWSGHAGGHFGNNQSQFLRAYVLPLLVCR
jgi:pimeloyl-ACP methyl ester carboxylesterase